MKKARLFFALTLAAIFAVLTLVGCSNKNQASSLSLKDYDSNTAIEMAVGNFEYEKYTLLLTYNSGAVEEIPLSEDMLAEEDVFKFYQEGEHDITVSHSGKKCTFKVLVKRSTFGEIKFSENNVFTYDGKAHTVEVEGDIPANAVITYPSGNSFVNAGIYDVKAIVSCEGYVTQKFSTTVKIERAKYDMSNVKFESKELVYDGSAHTLAITGTLPDGVATPKYAINGNPSGKAIDVGEYKITATFTNNNPNYESIPTLEATLNITPAEYSIDGVDIVFKTESGDIINVAEKCYDETSVRFDLNDYSKISKKADVSFSVCDENGVVISLSNVTTNMIEAGIYTVRAEFDLVDDKNYKPIEPIVRTFEIKKATYDMDKIHFDSNLVDYDGQAHRLIVEISRDLEITGDDVMYEYYLNGVLVASGKDVSVTEAGIYTVRAIITVKNDNYEPIEPLEARLQIEAEIVYPDYNPEDSEEDLIDPDDPNFNPDNIENPEQ